MPYKSCDDDTTIIGIIDVNFWFWRQSVRVYKRKNRGVGVFESIDTLTDCIYVKIFASKPRSVFRIASESSGMCAEKIFAVRIVCECVKEKNAKPLIFVVLIVNRVNWLVAPAVSKGSSNKADDNERRKKESATTTNAEEKETRNQF